MNFRFVRLKIKLSHRVGLSISLPGELHLAQCLEVLITVMEAHGADVSGNQCAHEDVYPGGIFLISRKTLTSGEILVSIINSPPRSTACDARKIKAKDAGGTSS